MIYLYCPDFRNLFELTIENKPTVSPAQKLYYLKPKLTEKALKLIKNIISTNNNYEGAKYTIKVQYSKRS